VFELLVHQIVRHNEYTVISHASEICQAVLIPPYKNNLLQTHVYHSPETPDPIITPNITTLQPIFLMK
jgi:hypothetical protein